MAERPLESFETIKAKALRANPRGGSLEKPLDSIRTKKIKAAGPCAPT
jgi:hypothetical protein